MKKKTNWILASLILILCCTGIMFAWFHTMRIAKESGTQIGSKTGEFVGTAIGSYKGYTVGDEAGKDAGEAAGLSAKDTSVNLEEVITSCGKLEVLSAGVTLRNINEIGETYKNLSIVNGEAVFAVDLSKASVHFNQTGDQIEIALPSLELKLSINQKSSKKLAEIQKFSWSVSAADGLNAYLNSMKELEADAQNLISNYEELVDTAKESAIKQVQQIASAVSVQYSNVIVTMEEGVIYEETN